MSSPRANGSIQDTARRLIRRCLKTQLAIIIQSQWPAKSLAVLVLCCGLVWALCGVWSPGIRSAASGTSGPTATSPRSTTLVSAGPLPHAWASPTSIPSPSLTCSPTATQVEPTATATPTRTPTTTRTASPTPTPIHRPAAEEPTRITAPSVGLDAKVVGVGVTEQYDRGVLRRTWQVADYAAGFHRGMALPGHVGNTVISGHNNIRGEVFRDIDKLKPGDDIFVWVGPSPYRYQVSVVYRIPLTGAPPEIADENLRWIGSTQDQRLTLLTCWPYWSNTHRTVVVAFPAEW